MVKVIARSFAGITFVLLLCSVASANTIIKIDFGDSTPDVEYSGGAAGVFSSIDDGDAGSPGNQNTNVLFEGLLGGVADITGEGASFTIDGVTADGAVELFGGGALVNQITAGGDFELYDGAGVLLLGATLDVGSISGPLGGSAVGSFLTVTFGEFISGSLLPLLGPANQASLAISLTSINGGQGLSIDGTELNAFTADATGNISAVPEPATLGLLLSGILGGGALRRRRKKA